MLLKVCLHFCQLFVYILITLFCFAFSGNLRPSHRQPPRGLRDLKGAASNSPADDLMKRYILLPNLKVEENKDTSIIWL